MKYYRSIQMARTAAHMLGKNIPETLGGIFSKLRYIAQQEPYGIKVMDGDRLVTFIDEEHIVDCLWEAVIEQIRSAYLYGGIAKSS